MKHKVIHAADVIRKRWSGGISSQYYIYPEGADRSTGENAFIVTSATVELEESTFSDYTGFDRVIMSLTGAYDLIHNDQESHHLQPFEPHAFTGEEKTVSKGVYTDCNLIMKRGRCTGEMSSVLLAPGSSFCGPQGHTAGRRVIWTLLCCAGTFAFSEGGNGQSSTENGVQETIRAGEMLVLEDAAGGTSWRCENRSGEDCRIVLCRVQL